jgi:hypothetical protein
MTTAYKLFRVRADGSLGPLFINRRQRVPMGEWVPAEAHPTAGYKVRPGWHAVPQPVAPHLSERGRAWYRVELADVTTYDRPMAQGGTWYTAERMRVLGPVKEV